MAHSNVKGATTKPTEASHSNLTLSQILDVFCWVLHATEGETGPMDFTPPSDSWEFTIMHRNNFDYMSVWILDGYPIAAGCPMDHFYRVIRTPRNH